MSVSDRGSVLNDLYEALVRTPKMGYHRVMTFQEYIAEAERSFRMGGIRKGQAYYNALLTAGRQDIARVVVQSSMLSGHTNLDPYYNDAALDEFLTLVMVKW